MRRFGILTLNRGRKLLLFLLLMAPAVALANAPLTTVIYPVNRSNDTIGPPPRESNFFKKGRKIKDFSVKDIEGNSYNLRELEGKVVVLNFWFIACEPCQREIPELNKLADEYKDSSRIVFIAIALDEADKIIKFIERRPFSYNLVPNGRFIVQPLRINRFPTHVVLNKKGYVAFHTTGFSARTIPWLKKSITDLL